MLLKIISAGIPGMKQSARTSSVLPRSSWRQATAALFVLWLGILFLYRETVSEIVNIWINNGTYAHGFIVLPISLWLVWRKREFLSHFVPKPHYLALIFLALSGLLWMLGELAAVNVVPQFSMIFLLIFSVILIVGKSVSATIAFPLFFMLFAVPFGEFTQPKLMEWTAQFTVLGLRFSGVPVYSEGQHIFIPTGTWSVVEACSGVRYLIASVTVGTLYAYLTYKSLSRRLVFVFFSFLVPIFANWLRAYLIVMLGHLSGNKLAVGVDHLIYGWFFFGFVIGLMFWVGSRWQENEPSVSSVPTNALVGNAGNKISVPSVALVGLLTIGIWPVALKIFDNDYPPINTLSPVKQIAGWVMHDQKSPEWRPKFENYSASSHSIFKKNQQHVGLFVAAYRNQGKNSRLVSSTNVLVESEDPFWSKVSSNRRQISFNNQNLQVRTAELLSTSGARLVVWQWYWINGIWTSNDLIAKLYTAYFRLIGHGDDSAAVFVYTHKDFMESSPGLLDEFIENAAPSIEAMLVQSMSRE